MAPVAPNAPSPEFPKGAIDEPPGRDHSTVSTTPRSSIVAGRRGRSPSPRRLWRFCRSRRGHSAILWCRSIIIQRLPPTIRKIRTAVKEIASRFSLGVVVKLMCRKKCRWQMHQDLQHRRDRDDPHDARGQQGMAVDQPERDGRQEDRQGEADQVGGKAVPFHHRSPGERDHRQSRHPSGPPPAPAFCVPAILQQATPVLLVRCEGKNRNNASSLQN